MVDASKSFINTTANTLCSLHLNYSRSRAPDWVQTLPGTAADWDATKTPRTRRHRRADWRDQHWCKHTTAVTCCCILHTIWWRLHDALVTSVGCVVVSSCDIDVHNIRRRLIQATSVPGGPSLYKTTPACHLYLIHRYSNASQTQHSQQQPTENFTILNF